MSHDEHRAWKSVNRPGPSLGFQSAMPEIAASPGRKMYMYVYDSPESKNRSGGGIQYPQSDECVRYSRSKWKKNARKVFPEVRLKGTSTGGKMFQNQGKRMKSYALTSAPEDEDSFSRLGRRSSPERTGRSRSLDHNSRRFQKREKAPGPAVLRPLRSPPPEWRAKVDADYPILNSYELPASKRWMREENLYDADGPKLTPPEDTCFEEEENEDNKFYASLVPEYRNGARVYRKPFAYNAEDRRRQRASNARLYGCSSFGSLPHVENDFNARPTGWSPAYAYYY